MTTPAPVITVVEAADVLFEHRHNLASDILRTLQNVYRCASAARYGEPHETGWVEDPEFYRDHSVIACESDGGHVPADLALAFAGQAEAPQPFDSCQEEHPGRTHDEWNASFDVAEVECPPDGICHDAENCDGNPRKIHVDH